MCVINPDRRNGRDSLDSPYYVTDDYKIAEDITPDLSFSVTAGGGLQYVCMWLAAFIIPKYSTINEA